ncbi:histidine phosphatase family protein [Clostridium sp.]|uniref:histidine phosphatase family protein n=1 Tax=Clostridium sp. TaxID=1506 RepID=UPI002FC66CA8
MSSLNLYLIRHGKTYCNERRLYCGKSDISLSSLGIEELNKKKTSTKYPKCKLNFTSGAKRANETFEILYGSLHYEVRKGFFEYDFGDFELKCYEDLKEDKRYIDWIMDKSLKVECPNGESKIQFRNRIKKALKELIVFLKEENEEEALVVCHGGTIGILLELFCDDKKDFYMHQPSCGGGYKLKVNYNYEDYEKIQIKILEEL